MSQPVLTFELRRSSTTLLFASMICVRDGTVHCTRGPDDAVISRMQLSPSFTGLSGAYHDRNIIWVFSYSIPTSAVVAEDVTCPTGLVKIWSPAPFRVRPGPHTLDTTNAKRSSAMLSFQEIRNGEYFLYNMVQARHGSDCTSSRRVSESAPVMAGFRYCTILLVHLFGT